MANPTIASRSISNQWQYTETTGELRIFSNETFDAQDSQTVFARGDDNRCFFKATLTISGDDVTIPQITTLPPNYATNVTGNDPRYTAEIWKGTGENASLAFVFLSDFYFPASPTSTDWELIRQFNELPNRRWKNPTLASTDYVNAAIAAALVPYATQAAILAKDYTRGLLIAYKNKTVENTNTLTTLITDTYIGSPDIPALSMALGKCYRLEMAGYLSKTGSPTLQIEVSLEGTVILHNNTPTLGGTVSTNLWQMDAMFVVTAIASNVCTIRAIGEFVYYNDSGRQSVAMAYTSTANINNTSALTLDIQAGWSAASASNTITCSHLTLEVMGELNGSLV